MPVRRPNIQKIFLGRMPADPSKNCLHMLDHFRNYFGTPDIKYVLFKRQTNIVVFSLVRNLFALPYIHRSGQQINVRSIRWNCRLSGHFFIFTLFCLLRPRMGSIVKSWYESDKIWRFNISVRSHLTVASQNAIGKTEHSTWQLNI